jgi:hypothetical protein
VIAALFVQRGGCYWDLPGVDPWDEARDARLYDGDDSVIAHPKCSTWCQLAYINQKRYGHRVGDGGCFASALANVRRVGGVLEHPARSYAWPAFGLLSPTPGGWTRSLHDDAWVCEVSQAAYGHRARKLTWLYYVGDAIPPSLDWRRPAPTAQISFCANHGDSPLPRLSKREASATPIPFRDLMLSIVSKAKVRS